MNFRYKSYLEIGVNDPQKNFDFIDASIKVGIDPVPLREDILKYESDDYFSALAKEVKFDLIFVDGLHHCEQVLRDIDNALLHLNSGGYIICHDMLPDNEEMQIVPRAVISWTGDCWKAWAHLRMTRKNLEMFVLNTDHGLGMIKPGYQRLFSPKRKISKMDYKFFIAFKLELMNIVEVDDIFND